MSEGQRVPLILEIHGGPFAAYGPHFSTDNQLYAAAGYAVLSVNPRGSTSYGEDFANQIHHAYPGRDYDDLISRGRRGDRRRLRRSRPAVRHRRLGARRAWRWASAISRAVISSAISARQAWLRVSPDSAARLNHLCASIRSTMTPPRPVE
jgi:hypothetical protein